MIAFIAVLMGHNDIRTTQRYVRVEPQKHEAVQATNAEQKDWAAVTRP